VSIADNLVSYPAKPCAPINANQLAYINGDLYPLFIRLDNSAAHWVHLIGLSQRRTATERRLDEIVTVVINAEVRRYVQLITKL